MSKSATIDAFEDHVTTAADDITALIECIERMCSDGRITVLDNDYAAMNNAQASLEAFYVKPAKRALKL